VAIGWELAEGDVIDPPPIHVSTFESWDSPERSRFPLQMIGFHFKFRTHSTYGKVHIAAKVTACMNTPALTAHRNTTLARAI
jgi:anaerobic selenocysteine-containing dehydrogenase